jgi:molybdenum cofactor cytidylyltransferase
MENNTDQDNIVMFSDSRFKAVILAAGSSSRMGSPKQLLKVQGYSMLDHAIGAALGAGLHRPVVVLGANRDAILDGIQLADRCELVFNPEYSLGQASSLVVGVKQIIDRCAAAVFLLSDQPLVTAGLVSELIDRFVEHQPDVLYPVYRKKRGNPVIINSALFPRLLNATGDTGARFLFRDTRLNIFAYEVDDSSVTVDIDTPEAFQALKQI